MRVTWPNYTLVADDPSYPSAVTTHWNCAILWLWDPYVCGILSCGARISNVGVVVGTCWLSFSAVSTKAEWSAISQKLAKLPVYLTSHMLGILAAYSIISTLIVMTDAIVISADRGLMCRLDRWAVLLIQCNTKYLSVLQDSTVFYPIITS